MQKVNNLRKALADIDAKAARLNYARERILEKLKAIEAVAAGSSSAASNPTPGSGVSEAPDATVVHEMDSPSAVVTESEGWTKDDVKAAVDEYLATHQCRSGATSTFATAIRDYAEDRTPLPISQIISKFVTAYRSYLEVASWDQGFIADLRDILSVCFHAGNLMDGLLPEDSNGHLENGPQTR